MASTAPVAILFTDIVGSTELHDRIGDDRANELRRRHFRLIREAVAASGGKEVKSLGDGLMVTFPSAVDGLSAAVAIQQGVERHNRDAAKGDPLQVRVGLNVGEAIRDEDDYFGTPVNIARRLCDVAAAGQILTTHLVRDLVGSRGDFAFSDLGALTLRGITTPVSACEVGWTDAEAEPIPPPFELGSAPRTPFIGREVEIAQLGDAWQQTLAGTRGMMVVAGEPGIGKSRLAKEFALSVPAGEGTVLFGRCDMEAILPYQPFVEATRGYIERTSAERLRKVLGDSSRELVRLIPELADRLPGANPPLLDEPETERYRLFQAFDDLLQNISRESPTLLVVEDLHWADRPTLLVLRHIMTSRLQSPLMVLGTYRDVEVDRRHPLTEALSDIRRATDVERISLAGLSQAEIRELVEASATSMATKRADELAPAIHRETEGNPFFAEEIVRHLAESGRLIKPEHPVGAGAGEEEDFAIPDSVRDIVARRLSALSSECNRVLSIAAVIGAEFELRLLQRVADIPMTELLEVLADAVEAQVLIEAPDQRGRFGFSHVLVRQVLYDDLGSTRRLRIHQRSGEALEEIHAGALDDHLARLSYHFLEAAPAGDLAKATDYALAAARHAIHQLAYEEAIGYVQSAIQAAADAAPDASRRCSLLLTLGDAQARSGDAETARSTFAEAAEIARALGAANPELAAGLLAEAALGFGGYPLMGDSGIVDQQLVSMIEEALAALDAVPSPLRCRLLARLAVELHWEHSPANRTRISEGALDMARALGDRALLVYALNSRIVALWGPDALEERLSLANEMVDLAGQADDDGLMATARTYRTSALVELGDIDGAFAEIDALEALANERNLVAAKWQATAFRTLQTVLQGRLEEAEKLAGESFTLGQQVRAQVAMQAFSGQIYSIRFNQGSLDELEPTVAGLVDDETSLPIWHAVLAHLYKQVGRLPEGRKAFSFFAEQNFDNLPRDAAFMSAVATLAEVCPALGDKVAAARLLELLQDYEDRVVMLWSSLIQGAVAYHMAVLALVTEEWERAEALLDKAMETHKRMSARPWLARTEIAYARLLMGRNQDSDGDRALKYLARARTTSDELGLGYLQAEIRELQGLAAGAPPQHAPR